MRIHSLRSGAVSLLVGLVVCLGIAAWPMIAQAGGPRSAAWVGSRVMQDPAKIQQGLERLLQRAYAQHRLLNAWQSKAKARMAKAKAKAKPQDKGAARQNNRLASVDVER